MSAAPIALAVLQTAAEDDLEAALAAAPMALRCVVRPPELAAGALPAGVHAIVAEWRDRADAARLVRAATRAGAVVVLAPDERPDPALRAALEALPAGGGVWRARLRHRFLGRDVAGATIAIAWCGADGRDAARLLDGALLKLDGDVATIIANLDADATRAAAALEAPVRLRHFLTTPAGALLRRLWMRRRDGVPGVILSLLESYGEVLVAAKRWERATCVERSPPSPRGVSLPNGFVGVKTPAGWMVVRRDVDERVIGSLLEVSPDNVLGVPIAGGGRGGASMLALDGDDGAVLRWYHRGGALRGVLRDRYFGRRPRPLVELAVTEEARRRGVPAVEVLGARVDRARFGFYRGVIATRAIERAATLADVMRRPLAAGERDRVLGAVARAIRTMHDRGVHHRDLNGTNVLVVRGDGEVGVHLIDFDRAQLRRAVPPRLRRRALRRLQRSLAKLNRDRIVVSPDERQRLVRAYWEPASSRAR